MADKLTKAQERVLRELHTTGKITEWAGGGSCRRMMVRMRSAGLLHCNPQTCLWEITAKGLRTIDALELAIVTREELERQREVQKNKTRLEEQADLSAAFERRKARIIAKVREELGVLAFLNDYSLWQLITHIVEIHEDT